VTPANTDPRETISNSPMSMLQIVAVAITIGLNALDGFDVLSISFASPGIAAEWGVERGALGIVLSMELIGMAIGSLVLGGVADKIGRRPTMLGCLVLMTVGMYMATTVKGIVDLSLWRVLTGLGIGGLLAAINAVAAEFSNHKRRHLSVSIMAIGYPVGAVVGGLIAAQLLKGSDWRSVFYFGAAVTAAFIPLVYIFVPESVHWLARKQPAGALEKINRTLTRMRHPTVTSLPVISDEARKRSISDIFAPALIRTTLLVAAAYFFHIMTFYYVLKWVPKIVVDMGFAASSAAGVLVWANVGGALGGAVLGLLTQKFGVKGLTIGAMVLSTVMVILFGRTPPDLAKLSMMVAFSGFFTNGAIVGMYAIFAQAFPTHVRASGTGFGIGIGRGGSVLAPIIAGFLFQGGASLSAVSFAMAFGSLLAAATLLFLKLRPDEPKADSEGEGETAPALKSATAS
jgi:benzoate transport